MSRTDVQPPAPCNGFCPDHDVPDENDNLPHDRRSMFLLGFRKLLEPVANYVEQRLEIALPVFREVLRPPGAQPEKQFLNTCYRCGNCISVCPAKAIRPLPEDQTDQAGTPYIDPDLAACVVCEELACMKACPSTALRLVDPAQISMGLAQVNPANCLRTKGTACTLCIDKCPFGSTALRLDANGAVQVVSAGSLGCGSCQFYCPATPKAITVNPQ